MWQPLTETLLKTRLSSVELSAFRSAAEQAGDPDPVGTVFQMTVDQVRGFIGACQRNIPLGPEGTLPDKLLLPALDLCVIEVMNRAAGTVLDRSGSRREAATRAMEICREVADCRFAIEKPDTYTAEITLIPQPSITTHHRRKHFGYRREVGL